MTEMIRQLLKVAYDVPSTSYVAVDIPVFVDTAVTWLMSYRALSGPFCLLAIRSVAAGPIRVFASQNKSLWK